MSKVGALIKQRRQELGLTLEQVGDAVGVGKSTVRKWETGYISNMRRDKIAKLASVLRLKPTDLIDADEDETTGESPLAETPSKEQLMFALFDGAEGVTDEMYEEVKRFAELVKLREQQKGKNE